MKGWVLVLLGLSFLPVWRDPAWVGGINGIQAIYWLLTQPPKEHIAVEEALARARAAYALKHPD